MAVLRQSLRTYQLAIEGTPDVGTLAESSLGMEQVATEPDMNDPRYCGACKHIHPPHEVDCRCYCDKVNCPKCGPRIAARVMAPLTEKRLSEIRERESKATKGPWNWRESEEYGREPQVWADHYPNGELAATEGSRGWSICKTRPKSLTKHSVLWPLPFGEHGWEDGQFIAHARQDIPYLLEQIESLRRPTMEQEIAKALRLTPSEEE